MHDPTAYYRAKKSEFEERLGSTPSETLQELLREAISVTQAAAVTFTKLADLAQRFPPYAKQRFAQITTNIDNSVENAARLRARLDMIIQNPKIDPELKKSSSLITYQAFSSAKTNLTASVNSADIFIYSFLISMDLLVDTLSLKLFRPNHNAFIANAVHEGVMAAIGALPYVGNAASVIISTKNVLSFYRKQFQTVSDYLTYLENYIRAAKLWNEAATQIIEVYEEAMTH